MNFSRFWPIKRRVRKLGRHRLALTRRQLWHANRDLRHRLSGTEWFAEQLRGDLTTCSADLELERAMHAYTTDQLDQITVQLRTLEASLLNNERAVAVAAPIDRISAETTVETPLPDLADDPVSPASTDLVRPYAVVPLFKSPLALVLATSKEFS